MALRQIREIIAALHKELGVACIEDLKRVCADGSAAKLAGFGQKTVDKLCEAITFREQHADSFRMEEAAPAAMEVLDFLRELPEVSRAEVGGSYRRGKEVVHDLDFLAATREPAKVMAAFTGAPFVASVIATLCAS